MIPLVNEQPKLGDRWPLTVGYRLSKQVARLEVVRYKARASFSAALARGKFARAPVTKDDAKAAERAMRLLRDGNVRLLEVCLSSAVLQSLQGYVQFEDLYGARTRATSGANHWQAIRSRRGHMAPSFAGPCCFLPFLLVAFAGPCSVDVVLTAGRACTLGTCL